MNVGGIVLCGGRSSRMGRPKAWIPFGGETMLQRVVRVVSQVVNPVVVVAAPDQDVPPLPADVRIVRDEIEDRGPLQGLAAGLAALEGRAYAAYLSSCDVALLKPEFVRRVVDEFCSWQCSTGGPVDVVVPDHENRIHPLAAVYTLTLLPRIRTMLASDALRIGDLCRRSSLLLDSRRLIDVDPGLASLRNVNTPEEYAVALAALATPEPPP